MYFIKPMKRLRAIFLFVVLVLGPAPLSRAIGAPVPPAQVSAAKEEAGAFQKELLPKKKILPIVLKLMIVNPSDKYKQTYPLKAYLPEEVTAENVLKKDDLDVGYDADKKAYYVTKEVELKPGETLVKSIEIKDIWRVSEKEMQSFSEDAHELNKKLAGTKFADQGKLLLNNIEVMLLQVFERQNDESMTPEEHISIFRENKQRLRDIEMDLMSLRRLVVASGGGTDGFSLGFHSGKSANGKDLNGRLTPWNMSDKDLKEMQNHPSGGAIPALIAWRIIFGIITFLGFISGMFLWTWQWQVRSSIKNRKKETKVQTPDPAAAKSVDLAEFLSPSAGTVENNTPEKPSDEHAA